MLARPQNQFCLTDAASSESGLAKHQIPIRPSRKHFPPGLALSLAVVLSCFVSPSTAFTANLLDTFDGTSLDATMWRQTNPQWISQNNALFLDAASHPGNALQVTTLNLGLGIGGSAQVQVTFTGRDLLNSTAQTAWLALTTDDSKYFVGVDSYAVSDEMHINPLSPVGYTDMYYSGGGNGNGNYRTFAVPLNTLFSLRLERLTATSVRYSVLNSANSIIAQDTRILPSYTDPLYLALGDISVDATFDNLQLSGNIIPEPSASALLGLGAAALVVFRRRK
jgi:hypothetical protein